jgi:hypothetical protein
MHRIFKLTGDIAGGDYTHFLTAAAERFAYFSLVWQDGFKFKDTAVAIRRDLDVFEEDYRRTSRWPGTVSSNKAWVRTYRLKPESLAVIERPGSVFSWRQPDYPEDLAFFRADRRCAFVSVTHERDAWILDLELASLLANRLCLEEELISDKEWEDFFNHLV